MFNWQGAVKVYMDALENPDSTPYAKECAREDIMVIAKIVDTLKEKFGKNVSIDDLQKKTVDTSS
jgi:predicted TIM-barrel enzyme